MSTDTRCHRCRLRRARRRYVRAFCACLLELAASLVGPR